MKKTIATMTVQADHQGAVRVEVVSLLYELPDAERYSLEKQLKNHVENSIASAEGLAPALELIKTQHGETL